VRRDQIVDERKRDLPLISHAAREKQIGIKCQAGADAGTALDGRRQI
jgi:hypothetical protein